MITLLASEIVVRVTDEAARIFAADGLAKADPVRRCFRDVRFLPPGDGTSETLRLISRREPDWWRGEVLT